MVAMTCIDRRQFLLCSAAASLALLSGDFMTGRSASAAMGTDYYVTQKTRLIKDFQDMLNGASQFLVPEMGVDRAAKITHEALTTFEKLIPNMPDVGGQQNYIASLIPVAGWYIAFYGPMRANGKKAEDVGRIFYELERREFEAIPPDKRRQMENLYFSEKYIKNMSDFASWTQRRQFPANWVATYLKGDGSFDYGVDYSECALEKYCRREGVPEVAPYICLSDFLESKVYNTGLVRTKTLATRDGVCNFRYKKGRLSFQDWGTEIAKIRRVWPK